jgi:diguanylate cyclase (GGDEF)-like protein
MFYYMSRKLEEKQELLIRHETELETLVSERTKELQDALEELAIIASTDSLTKIANRRSLKDTLKDEFSRAARSRREFSIILFDIDHFKHINDTYGHPMGDRFLIEIAKTTNALLRDIDMLGRYGGEEFLVILPETNLSGALDVSKRIKQAISEINIDGITCTASLGVAANCGVDSVATMMDHADDALYAAKDAGRNLTRAWKSIAIDCNNCSKASSCTLVDTPYCE